MKFNMTTSTKLLLASAAILSTVVLAGCDTVRRTIRNPVAGSIFSCSERPNDALCSNPDALPDCASVADANTIIANDSLTNQTSATCTLAVSLFTADDTCSGAPDCTLYCPVDANATTPLSDIVSPFDNCYNPTGCDISDATSIGFVGLCL